MVQIDQWSPLDHKAGMGGNDDGDSEFEIPSHVSDFDDRRLRAYQILGSYLETVARNFVRPPEGETLEDFAGAWREYGDAGLMVQRTASAINGESPSVGIKDGDQTVPPRPIFDPAPVDPATDGVERSDAELRIAQAEYAAVVPVWEENANAAIEHWTSVVEEVPKLQERERWLQQWAEDEDYIGKVLECEEEWIVGLGDGVYVYGWDPDRMRPTVEIFPPDAYFPILDDVRPSVFPKRVHLIWGFVDTETEDDMIRRLTWELLPLDPNHPNYDASVDLSASVKYLGENDGEQTEACFFTDEIWLADNFEETDQPLGGGEAQLVQVIAGGEPEPALRVPTGLDFIPLVHQPNTLSRSDRHFGRSMIVRGAQLLDEIAGSDTDQSLAGQWAARPPVAASDLPPGTTEVGLTPGVAVELGEKGNLFVVDMAKNLEGLLQRDANLRRTLSVVLQVPEGIVGRVDASDVPSGIAFVLSFTSFEQLIERFRMARAGKHSLGMKMVQRIAIQNDDPTIGGDPVALPAEFRFGPYMPQDLVGMANAVKILWDAFMIDIKTGMEMLEPVGVPYGDRDAVESSIRERFGQFASEVFDATGSEKLAAGVLGMELESADGVDEEADPGGTTDAAVAASGLNLGAPDATA